MMIFENGIESMTKKVREGLWKKEKKMGVTINGGKTKTNMKKREDVKRVSNSFFLNNYIML